MILQLKDCELLSLSGISEVSDFTESDTESEDEPKTKKLRICPENNEVHEYCRDETEYKIMHDK